MVFDGFCNRWKMASLLPFDAHFPGVVSKGARIPYNCKVFGDSDFQSESLDGFFQQIGRSSGLLRISKA
jgi:hypothetical protein